MNPNEINKKGAEYIDFLNSFTLKDADLYAQYASMKGVLSAVEERCKELNELIVHDCQDGREEDLPARQLHYR